MNKDFKDGVSDALLLGVFDENKSSSMYKQGYDFGMWLWNQQLEDKEVFYD
jgi:hypothetical protein